MSVQWCHIIAEPGLTISKRYSHSACCNGNSMYIFGGCTTANTTFNDLWRLDLGTRCWIRPLATGEFKHLKIYIIIHMFKFYLC